MIKGGLHLIIHNALLTDITVGKTIAIFLKHMTKIKFINYAVIEDGIHICFGEY